MEAVAKARDHRRGLFFRAAHRSFALLDRLKQAALVPSGVAQGGQFLLDLLDALCVGSQVDGPRALVGAEAQTPIACASRYAPVARQVALPAQRLEFIGADA